MAERDYVRDDDGRFAETPGGGSSAGGQPKQLGLFAKKGFAATSGGSAQSTPRPALHAIKQHDLITLARTPRHEVKTTTGGSREWTKQLPHGVMDTSKTPKGSDPETWHQHYSGHPAPEDKNTPKGVVSKERYEAVHRPIIEKALAVPAAKPGEKKVAIMTMGGPASGKSSGMRGIDHSKFVVCDPDDIKGKLPEYQKSVPKGGFEQGLTVKGKTPGAKKAQQAVSSHDAGRPITYVGAAAMVHEESSAISKEIRSHAIAQNKNVLIDGTGANAETYIKTIRELKSKGYEVHVFMPDVDVEVGLKRAMERGNKVGRIVPEGFIRKAYSIIPKNFEAISAEVDNFNVFDTGSPPNKDGTAPLKWSKKNGVETAHDPEFVANFKNKHFSKK